MQNNLDNTDKGFLMQNKHKETNNTRRENQTEQRGNAGGEEDKQLN